MSKCQKCHSVTYVKEMFADLAQESQVDAVLVHRATQLFAVSDGNFSALQLVAELRNNFFFQLDIQRANIFLVVFSLDSLQLQTSTIRLAK